MNQADTSWLLNTFKKSNVFSGLSDAELTRLIDHMERSNYAKDETIIKEGDQGEWFFVVYKGKIKVCVKKWMFKTVQVGTLYPEDCFGEMSLISNRPRSATLIAEEDSVCFMLFKNSFNQLIKNNEAFRTEIENLIKKRTAKVG